MGANIRNAFTLFIYLFIAIQSASEALKCRTREHMRQQQDFYNLASNCMKQSMNLTASFGESSSDQNRLKQQQQQEQQQQQQMSHHSNNNRPYYENYYESEKQSDNRYNRHRHGHRNHNNYDDTGGSRETNTCASPDMRPESYQYDNTRYRDDSRHNSYRYRKRDTMMVQKYVRKNSTNPSIKKSPLEDIGACVIHCIFREMKMLNSESKADRQAMINTMTSRIRDPELKEFIQDSIEECFDIMDSDVREDQCDFSKKLILCLEEKAKRGCEDWELAENSNYTTNFNNFNKKFEERSYNDGGGGGGTMLRLKYQ